MLPRENLLGLFYSTKQKQGEHPSLYIVKKKILAMISGVIPIPAQEKINDDTQDFKTPLLQSVNSEMIVAAGNMTLAINNHQT